LDEAAVQAAVLVTNIFCWRKAAVVLQRSRKVYVLTALNTVPSRYIFAVSSGCRTGKNRGFNRI